MAKENFTSHIIRPRCKTFPETRRAIRETQMSYDAVVILTDRKTRQFTGVSRKISPMQRIDTDVNSNVRGDNDHVRVPAKHKS